MEAVKIDFTAKDFKSDQQVRWCPGCGDYAIINSLQKVMAEIEDISIPVIQYKHLILSKMSSERLKDKADIEELQKINKHKPNY